MTTRTFTVFDDRELVGFLQDEPELLGIADALVASLGPEYVGRRAATARRRTNGLPQRTRPRKRRFGGTSVR